MLPFVTRNQARREGGLSFDRGDARMEMKTRTPMVFFWLALLCPVLALAQSPGGGHRLEAPGAPDTLRLAFVSDTQSPLFPETIALPRNNNEMARGMIFDSIVQFRPRAVFHMGDLVALGFHEPSWEAIDAFLEKLRVRGIGFYPILGNHELMLLWRAGQSNFQDRFPYASRTGYLRRAGPIAVVLLNSNLDMLTMDEGEKQLAWYRRTLRDLDSDSTVGLVIVGCHHSPYTNSMIVWPSKDAQDMFVPPFLESTKTRIFFSGHAHAAEHFRIDQKDFLVIGGGGGLQQPLLTGSESRWPDHFPQKTEKRMFHYVEGLVTESSASFTVRMLKDDFSGFYNATTLTYDFAPVRSGRAGTNPHPQE